MSARLLPSQCQLNAARVHQLCTGLDGIPIAVTASHAASSGGIPVGPPWRLQSAHAGAGLGSISAGRRNTPAPAAAQAFMLCMAQHGGKHSSCQDKSREYLQCRMQKCVQQRCAAALALHARAPRHLRGLMSAEDLDTLGFQHKVVPPTAADGSGGAGGACYAWEKCAGWLDVPAARTQAAAK